ncbi:lipopolysaccharide biosynthesis protein RfbH [Campylobacter californiensis]|uniref:lipopolysaccharide biosynthesis protein RfbH n=1 Tax=Campylobacter californiensis TaxID=1032243 RepID=UPI001473FD85|nr:lipopolysaccharide biosynthesis protein RfbH [Campylobacter sp. RM12916]MBE3609026.1 lipopolysaccharide biosynthesis protein RfbH [Campylobacter sp. RM12916]
MADKSQLKQEILQKVKEYYELVHRPAQEKKSLDNKSRINYAGRVFDESEMVNLVDSSLDFWLTYGEYSKKFEKEFAKMLGVKWAFLVNSGSSANLLAFFTLTSPLLKDRQVKRGDEVITVAAGFPTTVAPIVQYGAVPVFVDMELTHFNIDVSQLEKALSPKTKAVMVAHTLGNPFDIRAVKDFCDKHNLWLIEDNCDALGSLYEGKPTGTWGDIGTSSFYPPHHMTMGEGGATYTNNPLLKKIMLSMRDWGRDCWCESGVDNTCKRRFSQQFGELPLGYDHKYVYSHFGFNLKISDMQAAIGCAQIEKFPTFVEARKRNFAMLYDRLKDIKELILVKAQPNSDPSWFGFMMTVTDGAKFSRNELAGYLENANIQTRNLFAGNMTKHPLFADLKLGVDYRIIGELKNTNKIMNDSLWVGVYPGMSEDIINFMIKKIMEFFGKS